MNKKMDALEQMQQQNTINQAPSAQTKTLNTQEESDNYIKIIKSELPFAGMLYPESWEFAYRCPTIAEIEKFSSINEQNTASIIAGVNELIRKCYVIYDTQTKKSVSTTQINDGEKLFLFLKLRELYLGDQSPISYQVMSQLHGEMVDVNITSENIIYPSLEEDLLTCFDGRKFTIEDAFVNVNEPIVFHIPTMAISQKIYNYVLEISQNMENARQGNQQKNTPIEKIDNAFLSMLPFLFETGEENIRSLKIKYKNILNNRHLYNAYKELMTNLSFSNYDKVKFYCNGSVEETPLQFPNWKTLFINKRSIKKLY